MDTILQSCTFPAAKLRKERAVSNFLFQFVQLKVKNKRMVLSLRRLRKIYSMKIILIFSLILATVGCKTQKNLSKDKDANCKSNMITATIGEINVQSDLQTISEVRVSGNKLFIDINYSGGCEKHEFQVIGSKIIAKSLPPIRGIQLVHKANGDACKKLIEQTIEVDISALAYKQEAGSKIFLTLDGWKERIEYTFE